MINQGFILTRSARDIGKKTLIELWVSTPYGPAQLEIEDETPTFFVASEDIELLELCLKKEGVSFQLNPLTLKTFEGMETTACYFATLHDANRAESCLRRDDITVYETDIRLADRFMMERFIKGSIDFTGLTRDYGKYRRITSVKARSGNYKPELSVVSLDIECSENGKLYSVGLHCEYDSRVIMVGVTESAETNIQWVENEKALILALNQWFEDFDPDVIIGWNIIGFDFKLLDKRAKINGIALAVGRGNKNAFFREGRNQQGFVSIPGRVVIDGIDMLKAATYHFRSWSLESVSQELLGEGKAIDSHYDKMAEINHMFSSNKPALAKYNLQDCMLVSRIFDKTHLLDFAIERSCLTGIELDRVGGSVAAFTNLYLPQLHRAGYIAPNMHSEDWVASPGGYVMDSLPNIYNSVIVLDYKSLYPSIIRSFLIDPLGLIEGLRLPIGTDNQSAIEGFRGGRFHRQHHFLPKMVEDIWRAREKAKRNNNHAFSQALKIIMNSFYGVLGSSGCRFFDTRLASSITMRGHEVMKVTKKLIEEKGYQVIYGDTDSTFVALNSAYSDQRACEIGNQLVSEINNWWKVDLAKRFGVESYLELEYETHYQKFLMPTIRGSETGSKKRYAGLVSRDGEKKIIFKGLESARSDWTSLAQDFQYKLYDMVFNGYDPKDYVISVIERTYAGEFDDMLIYKKRLRRRLKDYQKNIPPQVKAALLADEKNLRLGRPLQYQNRGTIEYIITVNGPEPREYRESAIDYQHYIDKQLQPIADAILPFIGQSFRQISEPQIELF